MTILLTRAAKQLRAAYQTLVEEITPFMSHQNPSVVRLAEWALGKLETHSQTDAPADLANLINQAKDLEDVTQNWSIYEEVWEHEYAQGNRDFRRRAIQVGQDMVEQLYQSVIKQGITQFKRPHDTITVIPFFNRMTAGGFDSPAPYITTPRWGYTHPWNWSAYAHEVGHHIYRNVKGLRDELKVNIAHHLLSQGHDYSMASMWYNWLEEIFADLFGLLQMGPASAKTQQYVVLSTLPRTAIRHFHASGEPTTILRHAYDFTHPTPHLRVYLSWKALESGRLANPTTLSTLKQHWTSLFDAAEFFDGTRVGSIFVQTFKLGEQNEILVESEEECDPQRLADIGDQMLEVILNTELYSLAGEQGTARSIGQVFRRELPPLPPVTEIASVPSADLDLRDLVRWATDCFEDETVGMGTLGELSKAIINSHRPPAQPMA